MKTFAKLAVAGLGVFALLQLVRPSIPVRPAAAEIDAPPEVKQILEKDCYSCHSDERRLKWFDEVVPAYWLVRHDVLTAREHLDFSTLGSKPAASQRATLFEAANMIQLGAMPLPQFVQLHPEARVTPEELATLKSYLAPWGPLKTAAAASAGVRLHTNLAAVQPELNGVPFDPAFESWKLISVTDRGDNNTFRFILGNDVAVKAAQAGAISPWPDGARFAKIAWQQAPGSDGLVRPGSFVQVELMVKDAARYKQTDGWGWGRWRGAELKPYGSDAGFVNECTGCHQPVRGNDYVYTLPITRAVVNRVEVVNNRAAGLDEKLLPLEWRPITLFVDPKTRAMSVLFGNDAAMRAVDARTEQAGGTQAGTAPAYPADAALELVTWAQRDDPHWFGARIPDAPVSVEVLQVGSANGGSVYQRFTANGSVDPQTSALAGERTQFLLGLAPAQLP
jgi:mono/diheme cytochrome c family protein